MAKKDKKKAEEKPEDEKADDAAATPAPAPAEGAPPAEGEATEEGAEGEGEGKKKSKKKLIIIAAAALVVLVGGGVGAYMMLGSKGHSEEGAPKEKPIFYTMPEMIINLTSSTKNASFLKATIILELPHALDAVTVEAELPRLMDAFNTYVRELRPSDLAGSAGITRLREELLLRANKALEPQVKVNDVLFKEIVVQ